MSGTKAVPPAPAPGFQESTDLPSAGPAPCAPHPGAHTPHTALKEVLPRPLSRLHGPSPGFHVDGAHVPTPRLFRDHLSPKTRQTKETQHFPGSVASPKKHRQTPENLNNCHVFKMFPFR